MESSGTSVAARAGVERPPRVAPWAASVTPASPRRRHERLWPAARGEPVLPGSPSHSVLQVIGRVPPVERMLKYVRAVREAAGRRGPRGVIFGHAGVHIPEPSPEIGGRVEEDSGSSAARRHPTPRPARLHPTWSTRLPLRAVSGRSTVMRIWRCSPDQARLRPAGILNPGVSFRRHRRRPDPPAQGWAPWRFRRLAAASVASSIRRRWPRSLDWRRPPPP